MSLPINPETRVEALIEAYPGVEEVLIGLVPAFVKLKNPILRKTVAKVATLEQAARIGGISARDLIKKLREATGQAGLDVLPSADGFAAGEAPGWLSEDNVRHHIDADSMLETGVHPIGKVRECVAALETGEIVRLTSSFRPAPLIETMQRSGLAVYSAETSPGRHVTYFARQ